MSSVDAVLAVSTPSETCEELRGQSESPSPTRAAPSNVDCSSEEADSAREEKRFVQQHDDGINGDHHDESGSANGIKMQGKRAPLLACRNPLLLSASGSAQFLP